MCALCLKSLTGEVGCVIFKITGYYCYSVELSLKCQSTKSKYEACRHAPDLRAEVDSLLEAYGEADTFLERVIVDQAAALVAEEAAEKQDRSLQIGPYRVVREVGRGGMGAVYLAERADGQFEHMKINFQSS